MINNCKNSEFKYGYLSQFFHWTIAVLVGGVFSLGLYMHELPKGADKIELYNLHKSLGVLIIVLTVLRLVWFLISKRPEPEDCLIKIEVCLSKLTYGLFYSLLFIIPLSGWLLSSAGGHDVSVFGLFDLPNIIRESHVLKEFMEETHEIVAFAIIGLAGFHSLTALKHHFIDKDNVLKRMLPFK